MEPSLEKSRPSFSQMLRVRLIEDACVRAHVAQVRAELETARAEAKQARRGAGLLTRLLAKLGRDLDTHLPAGAAAIITRENERLRQYHEVAQLLQRYTDDLNTLLTMHLHETMPEFHKYSVARKSLAEWESAVNALRAAVRGLLKALGQARGSVTSGYNKSKHTISDTAQEAFQKALEAVRSVEARLKQMNAKARELGGLPEVAMIPCEPTIRSLPGLEIGAMQKEFDRLTAELEEFETKRLANLMEPEVQAAGLREAQANEYVRLYREQLRAFSDRQMKPIEMARAIPGILARQTRP